MCGRYVSKLDAAMEREWALSRPPPVFESYNIAPSQNVPVVREQHGQRSCELIRWGLVPRWAKGIPPKLSTINARIETISTAASYRGPWKQGQRCILPALGFYEWQVRDTGKQPFYIWLADQALFGLAGLWERSPADDGSAHRVGDHHHHACQSDDGSNPQCQGTNAGDPAARGSRGVAVGHAG